MTGVPPTMSLLRDAEDGGVTLPVVVVGNLTAIEYCVLDKMLGCIGEAAVDIIEDGSVGGLVVTKLL